MNLSRFFTRSRLPAGLILCLLWLPDCSAQDVSIRGSVDTSYLAQTRSIRIFTYADMITYAEKDIVTTPIDASGKFEVKFSIARITRIFLEADNARAELVAEPGHTYEVIVLPRDSQAVNVMGIPVPVGIEFLNSGPEELNYLLADFNTRYETFIEDHRALVAKKDPAFLAKADTLEGLLLKKYEPFRSAWLNTQVEYTFAQIKDAVTTRGKDRLYKHYLSTRPVMADHPEYMAFFHQYYSIYAERIMNSDKMNIEVNSKMSYAGFELAFKESPWLVRDSIREMVMLKSLSEYPKYPHLKKSGILELSGQCAKYMSTSYGKQTSSLLFSRLSVMAEGSQVPGTIFHFPDGKTAGMSKFKGKYIYLMFWSTASAASMRELSLIPALKKMFGSRVLFISVCLDRDPQSLKEYLKKHPDHDWTFLYFDDFRAARKEWGVISVPSCYLIGPSGKVLRSPAPGPEEAEPLLLKVKKKQL